MFTSILVVSLCPSLCPPHPGLVSSDKASASYLLTLPEGGQVAVLAVGGPLEASEAKPGTVSLRLGSGIRKDSLNYHWNTDEEWAGGSKVYPRELLF